MQRLHKAKAQLLLASVLLAAPDGMALAADLISTHGDWKAYRHGVGDRRMCFAVTRASDPSPAGADRQKPHIYITAWPSAGIKSEISVLVGTMMRRGTDIRIEIGGRSFSLQADGDRAFLVDPVEEQRLLEAMQRGKILTVATNHGQSESLRDTFSLSGVSAAVQAAASVCQ